MKKYLAFVLIVAGAGAIAWADNQAPAAAPEAKPQESKTLDTAATSSKPAETAAPAPKASVKLEKLVIAKAIENREPGGEAASFGADVTKVYCWTKFAVPHPAAKVRYVWSLNGAKIDEYEASLNVDVARWWAAKTVQPGSWKVEVLAEGGESLGSGEFKVTADAAPKAAAATAPVETDHSAVQEPAKQPAPAK